MRRGWRAIPMALVLLTGLLGAPNPNAPRAQGASGGTPVATVGDDVITLEELEEPLAAQLAELEQKRHQLLSERLEHLIGERLLAQEATRRGISVEELLKREVYARAREVTDAEVTAFMRQNRARLPRGADEAHLRLKVWDYLRSQQVSQRRREYVGTLRAQAKVTVSLREPEPPRTLVSPDKGFTRGPANARVVLVEFSDFQSPFCKRVLGTVRQLIELYPGQVKWVFRDFPIERLHPTAPKVHEAARCAGAQGKFWEYHDLLFERAPRHAPEALEQYARELALDGPAFVRCLDGGASREAIAGDIEEGRRLGVTATPTFFINGRKLVGAKPLAEFRRLIESELAR